ncbi:MAG TPA: hypothetical protein VK982_11485 [Bacteroidales bacterium]|nr:hypothetical protein [Bacteroidales bacterium]
MKALLIANGREVVVDFKDVFNLQLTLTVEHGLVDIKTNREKVQKLIVSEHLTKTMKKDLMAMAKSLGIMIDLSGDWVDEDATTARETLGEEEKLQRLGIPQEHWEEYREILMLGEEFRTKMRAFLDKYAKHKVACGIYIGNKKLSTKES